MRPACARTTARRGRGLREGTLPVQTGSFRQIANTLEGKPCRIFIAPVDVRLPKADESDQAVDTVVQPDVLVVCDERKLGEHGVRGAPDWVAEVLSPATAAYDQVTKRRIYERHGVKEYWLIHPTDSVLTVYRLSGTEYGKPDVQELVGETPVRVLPGLVIRWDALASGLPGRDP